MKKLWYVVYKITYGGEVSFLKDPDFCRGEEVPFKTYTKNDKESVEAFLPWMTQYKATAFAQASLLESIDAIKHSVGVFAVDFDNLLDMDTKNIVVNLNG